MSSAHRRLLHLQTCRHSMKATLPPIFRCASAWLRIAATRFARTLTEQLLTFALGRGVEYYDAPAVRKIVRDAEKDGYRFSSLILGIVKSVPFQMRGAGSKEASVAS